MGWEPTFITDGDVVDSTSVNDALIDARTWLNDIDDGGARRGAFNHHHAGKLIREFTGGAMAIEEEAGIHVYEHAIFLASLTYAAYGVDGGTDEAANIGDGQWTMIGHESQSGAYTGGACRVTWTSGFFVGMDNGSAVGAVLILLNVQLWKFVRGTSADGTRAAAFCIQYQLDGGTWYTLQESERYVDNLGHVIGPTTLDTDVVDFDVPIAVLLTAGRVEENGDPTTDRVTGVRGMVSLYSDTIGIGAEVHLRNWNLTVLPLFCAPAS